MFHRDFVAHVSKYICNKSCIENAPECRVLDNFIGTIDKCGSICTLVNVGKQTSYSVRVLIYLTTSELCILKMIGQYLDSSLLSYLNKIKLQRKLQNIMQIMGNLWIKMLKHNNNKIIPARAKNRNRYLSHRSIERKPLGHRGK